ncbi:MAG TPA: PPA1309 family protein [Mycobacteriales bacterium]|nr:PPA1309 family protein [Mycobacteriales bacterium]
MATRHPNPPPSLADALVEVERHVGAHGWDQPPQLFALVATAELVAAEPDLARSLGLPVDEVSPSSLTPIEQEPLPDGPLDDALAQIMWSAEVRGCCLVHEVVLLPPDAEAELPGQPDPLRYAAEHPHRREARVAVAVLRDGSRATVVRFRRRPTGSDDVRPEPAGTAGVEDELLVGEDLAPNLSEALLATLADPPNDPS